MWEDLKTNYSFTFLLTGRLNQDPIEKFFSVVGRNKGDNKDNPNAKQFGEAFVSAMCNNMMTPSKITNCIGDLSTCLLGAQKVFFAFKQTKNQENDEMCTTDSTNLNDVCDAIDTLC